MTIETNDDIQNVEAELPEVDSDQESSGNESQQYSDHELQAMEMGWKPKDQLEDGKEFVSAEEFIRRGELFEKIDYLGKELKDTKKALRMLATHHEKVRETEYQRALQSLKIEKKAALEEGDADRLIEIDERITDVKAAQLAEAQAAKQQAAAPDPRFAQWVERNPWYAQDPEMRAYADEAGLAHARAFPDKDPGEVLKYVSERIRKIYSDKFQNPKRNQPSAVEGSAPPKSGKRDTFELDADEKSAMHTFVRQGIMTKEEYIAELKRVKGVQ